MDSLGQKKDTNLKNLHKLVEEFDKKVKHLEKSRRNYRKQVRSKKRTRLSVDLKCDDTLVSFGDSFSTTLKDELENTQPHVQREVQIVKEEMNRTHQKELKDLRQNLEKTYKAQYDYMKKQIRQNRIHKSLYDKLCKKCKHIVKSR